MRFLEAMSRTDLTHHSDGCNVIHGGIGPPLFGEVEMAYVTYGRVEIAHVMSEIEDLEEVKRAVVRETVIRGMMTETGESREIVAEMFDANNSMNQESVLELTEGEPTTLADALTRYVDVLEASDPDPERIAGELTALLTYPWPDGPAPANAVLKVDGPDDETLIISVGGVEVATANHDEHGWSGMELAQRTAEGVHRAVLAAVRAESAAD
jgi:hypothetical protein